MLDQYADVLWGVLTLLAAWYAFPSKSLVIPFGIFLGVMLTQGLGDLVPLTWGAIDILALTGAFYLYHKGDRLALILGVILSLRLLLHLQQIANPMDLYTYYLTANLLYGALLLAIVSWKYYYSSR